MIGLIWINQVLILVSLLNNDSITVANVQENQLKRYFGITENV